MQNAAQNQGIKNSWSLIGFAKMHGKMQIGQFEKDGEKFSSCIFTNPTDNTRVFVGFSSKLGELSPAEIAAEKDSLQVVQLESDNFYLCKQGSNSWADVDLGI